ncbi:MAG: class I SAM-dependent rRNA methyltransferase [Clostridia bacterium]|nr:class I SAM-dependent rRNA methyltransferase [Clostridia bacterium]
MQTGRPYQTATVTEKAEEFLRGGHVWVYGEEILSLTKQPRDGDIVDIVSQKGKYLGSGFFNSRSKIRIRTVSKNANDRFDAAFWVRRVEYAVRYRQSVMGKNLPVCRLIFGEADGFPGLVADLFESLLVLQNTCLGTEQRLGKIVPPLLSVLSDCGVVVEAVYMRNDSSIRTIEGLPQESGFWQGDGLLNDYPSPVLITESGIKYELDYREGQKTGFFLDQKYNRLAIRPIAAGKRVLDCCTHTGSFALHAAAAGALSVEALDISPDAVEAAQRNAKHNGLEDKITFRVADVFDFLEDKVKKGAREYDLVILDPPAFTKSRETLRNAIKGYLEINTLAMRLLPKGGYLATCSCSHFMTETYFRQMLHNAAAAAGVSLRQVEARKQAPDHPILWNVPETDYLKFYIFQIV